jgi:hypothetical protein
VKSAITLVRHGFSNEEKKELKIKIAKELGVACLLVCLWYDGEVI